MKYTGISHRTSQLIMAAVIVCGVVGSYYYGRHLQLRTAFAQPAAQPFYLERTLFDADEKGQPVASERQIVIRRADGTTVRIERIGTVQISQEVRVVTHPDGTSARIADGIRAKSTFPSRTTADGQRISTVLTASPRDCGAKAGTLYGFGEINGLEVALVQSTYGGYRITRSKAAKLGCEDLYYKTEQVLPDGAFRLVTEARVVRLDLREPDPNWFSSGAGFDEVKPSELQQRILTGLGITLGEANAVRAQSQARQLDDLYSARPATASRLASCTSPKCDHGWISLPSKLSDSGRFFLKRTERMGVPAGEEDLWLSR